MKKRNKNRKIAVVFLFPILVYIFFIGWVLSYSSSFKADREIEIIKKSPSLIRFISKDNITVT